MDELAKRREAKKKAEPETDEVKLFKSAQARADAQEEDRKRYNQNLIRRMRRGDNLCHTDLSAFRWAPRAIIKKDPKAISALYGSQEVKEKP